MCNFISTATLILVAHYFSVSSPLLAQNVEVENEKLKWLTDSVDAEYSPQWAPDVNIFENVSKKTLLSWSLKNSGHVAVRSKWELLKFNLREPPNHRKLDQFSGFLEGRFRTNVPKWWISVLVTAKKQSPKKPVQFKHCTKIKFLDWVKFQHGWKSKNVYSWSRLSPVTLELQDERTIILPEITADQFASVFVARDGTDLYIELFDVRGGQSKLICFSTTSSKIKWSKNVWGDGIFAFSGIPNQFGHVLDISFGEETVTVFGQSNGTIYCESFMKTEGKPVIRFCPSETYSSVRG